MAEIGPDSRPDEKGIETISVFEYETNPEKYSPDSRPDEKGIETESVV